MRKLDRKRPFGTIIGETENGARFNQDGIDFDVDGNAIGDVPEVAPEPVVVSESAPVEEEPAPEMPEEPAAPTGFEAMSAAEVKARVIELGGEYTNKQQGIEFLKQQAA